MDTSICTHTSANVNVNEGPAVLVRNGKVFIVFSASACDESYCLGMLTANQNADLCDMESWKKTERPVFTTSVANAVYGPGHCSFTKSSDYQWDLIVYHARSYPGLYTQSASSPGGGGAPILSSATKDGLSDPHRSCRVKVFTWNKDGSPNFGEAE
jgi:GH43 family beta-xylosidase